METVNKKAIGDAVLLARETCAIVVSFNRSKLLRQTLDSIKACSPRPKKVIVIDNGSSDDTFSMVRTLYPWCDLLRIDKNRGGATAFYHGFEAALKSGMQWIWTLDDDVVVPPNAMLKMAKFTQRFNCINPSRVTDQGHVIPWEGHLVESRGKVFTNSDLAFDHGRPYQVVNYACFEGMLVKSSLVKKVGLPEKTFFISGYDTLFGYRASLVCDVVYIPDRLIRKTVKYGSNKTALGRHSVREGKWKHYVHVRDAFQLIDHLDQTARVYKRAKIRRSLSFLKSALGCLIYDKSPHKCLLTLIAIYQGWSKNYPTLDANFRRAQPIDPVVDIIYLPATKEPLDHSQINEKLEEPLAAAS
ncbi:MAG: glycosyltransferase [Granulosicoccaceae bacterium]